MKLLMQPSVSKEPFKRVSQTMPKWNTTSSAEKQLASILIQEISSNSDKYKQAEQLYQITLRLLNGNAGFSKDWPNFEDEITSNLIAEIVYQVELRDSDVKRSGSYFTPHVLAADMVNVAAQNWKRDRSSEIENAIWYDPCVGGGIFPVAIARFLLEQKMPPERIVDRITGSDINPLFAQATRIRLALVLSKGDLKKFTQLYNRCLNSISEEDSLLNFSEISDFFAKPQKKVDIVIGNPPYVRSNNLSPDVKKSLRMLYPSIWSGTTDLYMFFIAHGLNALKTHGVLCYVSPATFQRTSSASQIREYILNKASIHAVFDFDELEVFQNVHSHISVYALIKNATDTLTKYSLYTTLPAESPLTKNPFPIVNVSLNGLGDRAWSFHPKNTSILPLLERDSLPLRAYFKIYSGIKTGLKNAYELVATKHDEILNDEKSKQYIYRLVKPQQIEKWDLQWKGTYQIVIPRGQTMNPDSKAYQHLLGFKDELSVRSDLQKDDPWYSLRDCAYLDLFNAPKIVYRDISAHPRFALDKEGMAVVDGAFFMPTTDLFLLGLLNSKVGEFYFKSCCATIGSIGSRARLRFKKVYVSEFPIPKHVDSKARAAVERFVEQMLTGDTMKTQELEHQMNSVVLDIYRVPFEQRQTILES